MEQWLSVTGQDSTEFIESMKGQSEQAVKVDLALRAVAAAEGLEVDDDDLDAEYERIAVQVREKPNEVRKAYERNDAVPDLIAQIRKSKALDWLLHHVEIVDPEGHAIDRDLVLGHTHDDDDDDDDHDRRPRHDHALSRQEAGAMNLEPRTTSFPTSSSRRVVASGRTTSTAVCSRRTSSSCRRRSTTRSPA